MYSLTDIMLVEVKVLSLENYTLDAKTEELPFDCEGSTEFSGSSMALPHRSRVSVSSVSS